MRKLFLLLLLGALFFATPALSKRPPARTPRKTPAARGKVTPRTRKLVAQVLSQALKNRKPSRKLLAMMDLFGPELPDFPPLPAADEMPVIINAPPVDLPIAKSPHQLNSKVLLSTLLVYPKKKQRNYVHHGTDMLNAYRKALNHANKSFSRDAAMNPYYQQYLESSAAMPLPVNPII